MSIQVTELNYQGFNIYSKMSIFPLLAFTLYMFIHIPYLYR